MDLKEFNLQMVDSPQSVTGLSARLAAFHNVVGTVNINARLPEQVFLGHQAQYLFFESDNLFAPSFVRIAQELMDVEGSASCCLLNFSRTLVLEFQTAETLFIEDKVTESQYDSWLRNGGPASGWLFAMERYGVSSNKGGWCIYCEKDSDIAVIRLQKSNSDARYPYLLGRLSAKPIKSLLRASAAPFPLSHMTAAWRAALVEHYG